MQLKLTWGSCAILSGSTMKRVKYYAPNWFNPITREAFGWDHQIIDHDSKMAVSRTSKFGDFLFYLLDTFWQNLAKSIHQGVAAFVFEMRRLEKLNIRIFLFHFKPRKCRRRYKFVPGKFTLRMDLFTDFFTLSIIYNPS